MKDILQLFCVQSRQRVNMEKSPVFFSSNINPLDGSELAAKFGIPETNDLGRYLGMPLLHRRVGHNTYHFLVEKVRKKLCAWKGRTMSMASQALLIQTSSFTVAKYAMQTILLPFHTLKLLEKAKKGFLWGDTNDCTKIHTLAWKHICQPKENGGLGLKTMKSMNKISLPPSAWRFLSQRDSLWVRFLHSKYGDIRNADFGKSIQTISNSWRSLVEGYKFLRCGLEWEVRNGKFVRF